ncbi:MAG: hypothetical protein QXJ74_05610 [Nitrososphaera sp.]|nr:hypothetical protein [Nitrososphaera sp.]NWG36671.1 hypothetical protein [Nitrososphaera sp.]
MRKIQLVYRLKRKGINTDEIIPYLFVLAPIITVLFVMLLWSATGAGR